MLLKKLAMLALAGGVGLSTTALLVNAADEKPAGEKTVTKSAPNGDAPKPGPDGSIELFNGKDLSNWDGNPDFWSVSDGTIQGQTTKEKPTKGNTFLIWKGGDVGDFELTFKYKIVAGNSGVQYRSKENKDKKWVVGGYQADFEAGKTYSGILYEEGGRGILANRGKKVTLTADGQKKEENLPMSSEDLQKSIKNEDWNDYKITAKGGHLTHQINGNTTSETIDESGKGAKSGILALQLHAGPPMTVQFKDLKLKPIGGDAK